MLSNCLKRFATKRVDRCRVYSLGGEEWFGVSKDGKGMLFTTGPGAAPTPPDFTLLTVGACSGDDVKYVLERNDRKVKGMKITVEGEWAPGAPRRFKEIRIKYDVDCDVSPEDLKKVADSALGKLCPVANTLKGHPTLSAKVTLVK